MENKGTPKTMEEAITNAICIGPVRETPQRLRSHIRDFLSQKFGVALLNASESPEAEKILNDLWTQITGETL